MSKAHSVSLILITRSKYAFGTKDRNLKYRSYGHKERIKIEFPEYHIAAHTACLNFFCGSCSLRIQL